MEVAPAFPWPDGDFLTYTIIDGPQHGHLTGTAPDLTYHHSGGGMTTDWFTFKVFDGQYYTEVPAAETAKTLLGSHVSQQSQWNVLSTLRMRSLEQLMRPSRHK